MPDYVVEFYLSHPDETAVALAADHARSAALANPTTVHYLRSMFIPEDEVGFHLFRADSRELVRDVATRAGLPVGRVIEIVARPQELT